MLLYINGNYPYHSLHRELVLKLAEMGNEIVVFVPTNNNEPADKNDCVHSKVRIIYCECLSITDRVFFLSKISKIVRKIEKMTDVSKIDCILAGTVYSDGAVAYLLHKKYQIPFSVAVRETDITYQMKWRKYLNGFVKRILNDAEKIIFLSPAYQRYIDKFCSARDKFVIIPNAVNDFWFQNKHETRKLHNPLSLIYVGEISERKNVTTTISVLAELKQKQISAVFHIVGSGDEENNCRNLAAKLGVTDLVSFHGWQNSKEIIKQFYDISDIFVMPSLRETFGTVYIEALTQGLPVLYTRGQGIDGYFEQGRIGYACNPQDVDEITEAIAAIAEHYTSISNECIKVSEQFQWTVIAEQYNNTINDMRKQ